jgi:hypothetical protein
VQVDQIILGNLIELVEDGVGGNLVELGDSTSSRGSQWSHGPYHSDSLTAQFLVVPRKVILNLGVASD